MAVLPMFRRTLAHLPGLLLLAATGAFMATCGGDGVTTPQEGQPAAVAPVGGASRSGTVGQPVAESLVVLVTDGKNRPVQDQPVAFVPTSNGTGAVLVPDTAKTDVAGHAAARWVLGSTAGAQAVEARVVGFPSLKTTFTAQAAPDAAATLTLVAGDNQSGVAGAPLTDSLVVQVADQYGNGVPGITVNWSVTGGGSVSATATATDAGGRAAVQRVLGSSSGTQTAVATVAGLSGSPVTFTQTAGSGTATALEIVSGDNQTGPAGFPVAELKVKLVDANGNGVPGRTVTWVVATGGGSVQPSTSVTSDTGTAATTWTLGPSAGANTLNAVSGAFSVTFHATGNADMPTTLAANSATSQNGTAGQNVSTPPSVKVTDANHNGVQGVGVTFAVTAGGGSVTPVSVNTNASGVATVTSWTLGAVAGSSNQLTASVSGLSGSPVTFTATAGAGSAAQLAIVTQPPATAQSGVAFTTDPVVEVQDINGNPVTGSHTITASLIGGGTLGGTLSHSTAGGSRVTFNALSITGSPNAYQLVFNSSGLSPDTSNTVALGSGAPTQVVFGQQPSNVIAGTAILPAITVKIEDAVGTVVPSNATVNLNLGNNPGGDPLGTVSVPAMNGVATFSGVVLQKSGSGYTLVASSSGLAPATSSAFNVSAAGPASLTFTQQPSNAVAGSAITPAVKVTLLDAFGNVATGSSATVTMGIGTNAGGGTLSGTTSVAATSGVATFTNLKIDKAGNGYTLTASSSGLAMMTSSAFNVSIGSGNVVAFTTQPTNTVAGSSITPAVVVAVQDGSGNTDTTATNQITVFIGTNPGGGHLSGTSQKNAVKGIATFSNLSIDSAGTGYTLSASATGLISDSSSTFSITPGPPSASASGLTVSSSSIAASSGGTATTITVTARDALSNVIPGASVVVNATGSGNTVSPSSGTTNSSGLFTATLSSTKAESKVVSASVAGVGITQTRTVTVTPGPADAAHSTASVPSTGTSGSPTSITITAKDAFSNPLTTGGAAFVVAVTGANSASPTVTDHLDGTYTASYTPSATGSDNIAITLGGLNIAGSPFTSAVGAGPVSASASSVGVSSGSIQASSGSNTSTVTVTAKDASGNVVSGASVAVNVTGSGNSVVPASGTTNSSGQFTATLSSTKAESKTVSATVNTVLINQTQTVTVTPGPADAAHSTATVPASGTAGSPTSMTITAKDAFGNPLTTGGTSFAVSVTGANSASPVPVDLSNGTYTASYTPVLAGVDNISITLASVSISGSPFSSSISAGSVSASNSQVSISGSSITASSGSSTTDITVTAKDGSGNTISGASVVVSVSGSGNTFTASGSTNGSGQFVTSLSSTKAESKTISATINGVGITQTQTVSVNPDILDPGSSDSLSVTGNTVGGTVTITIQGRDQFGNAETTGGSSPSGSVDSGPNAGATVTGNDQGDGTYTIMYNTGGVTGDDSVTIQLDGSPISGSPLTITIN